MKVYLVMNCENLCDDIEAIYDTYERALGYIINHAPIGEDAENYYYIHEMEVL